MRQRIEELRQYPHCRSPLAPCKWTLTTVRQSAQEYRDLLDVEDDLK